MNASPVHDVSDVEVPASLAESLGENVKPDVAARRTAIALDVLALAPSIVQHENDTRSAMDRIYLPLAALNVDMRETYVRTVGKKSAPDYFAQTQACKYAIRDLYAAAFEDEDVRQKAADNVRQYVAPIIAERATASQLRILGKSKTQLKKKADDDAQKKAARDEARQAVITATGAPERQAAAVVTLTSASEDKFGVEERLSVVQQLLGDLATLAETSESPVLDIVDEDGDIDHGWANESLRESLASCYMRLDAITTVIENAEKAEKAAAEKKAAEKAEKKAEKAA